jgi:tRNA-uridine 2-sulfurtransferase
MSETAPIAVAMSGGVDSSTVAALLARQGLPVIGLTMQLWNQRRYAGLAGGAGRCCSIDDVHDARRVAGQIGIPYYVVNFEAEFEREVVAPFVADYLAGRTPIPCTLCNNHLKFARLLETARNVGARQVATGHYARIRRDEESGRYQLLRGLDSSKDQTYFLFGLTQEQLACTLFPLGEMTKSQVRELAAGLGLEVAAKQDSQEICFVPDGDYAAFLDSYLKETGAASAARPGEIVTADGRRLGGHCGVHHFTVGQRRGLGIATGEPLYVISTDAASGRVVVGGNEELLRTRLSVERVNWVSIAPPAQAMRATVKIRNRHEAAAAQVLPGPEPGQAEVIFDTPQRAVTPGQAAVFYQDEIVLGGGWIE